MVRTLWKKIAMCATLSLGAMLACPGAFAADKVTLKDGTVLEGTITREVGGIVWMKTKIAGVEQEKMILPEELKSIAKEGDAEAKPAEDTAKAADGKKDDVGAITSAVLSGEGEEPQYKPGVPKALVLTMGDEENGHTVGIYMTADIVRRAIPTLEKELGTDRTGILVIRIHSGGGLLLEIQRLSDLIEYELKPRFRVVAWIDHAISAAAMTAHCIEEIYFTTDGEYGSCTGFAGGADRPVEGYELQEVLAQMEKISDRGKHDRLIMRAMQIQQALSATVYPDGTVKFFPDTTSGEIVVNRANDKVQEVLTFNANSALKVKFSSGTADSLSDLARLMNVPEIQWVGKQVKGVPWPISKSEEMQIKFRRQTKEDAEALNRMWGQYQRLLGAAQAAQPRDRPSFVGQARQSLERLKAMFKNNPNQKLLILGGSKEYDRWVEQQERTLRDLLK